MVDFYHFMDRTVQRFPYCCRIMAQGPANTIEYPPLLLSSSSIRRRLDKKISSLMYPIDYAVTSARATKDGAEFHGFCRHGRICQKEDAVHVYVRRREYD